MGCDVCPGGDDEDVDGCGGGRGTAKVETEVEREAAEEVVETEVEAEAAEEVVEAEVSVYASESLATLPAEADSRSLYWRYNKYRVTLTVCHVDSTYDRAPSVNLNKIGGMTEINIGIERV